MLGITIDGTVRVGDLIVLASFIGLGIVGFANIKTTLRLFGYRLDIVDASIEDLKREYGNGRVQDAKIERLENDQSVMRREIFDMQRGRSFVTPEQNRS